MKVYFLILNYNSWELTKKLATKVCEYDCVNQVVIVDNDSSDCSYKKLKEIENIQIKVYQTDRNGGYSYGNNYGARICGKEKCDILLISNPDVDIDEKDVLKILNAFQDKKYALLSGVEYDYKKHISKDPIWNFPSYKDDLLYCYILGRKIPKKHAEIDFSKQIQQTEIVKGSFFAVRMEDFVEVGGFDENVFLFCEERILARKLMDKGKRIGLVTGARYYHNHSASINKQYKSVTPQMKILYKSILYYYKKYTHIGIIKETILKLSMVVSLTEYKIRDVIKKGSNIR